jgi:hypothetical protein
MSATTGAMFKLSAIGAAKKSARVLPAATMPRDTGRAMSQENVGSDQPRGQAG